MCSAKVILLVLSISSLVAVEEVRINGPLTDAASFLGRVRAVNFRNGIQTVSYESAASRRVLHEETRIPGYANSGIGRNNNPPSYSFDYMATDEEGNVHFRKEQGDDSGIVRGSYGYTDIEGLYRTVNYIADSSGFHASIMTNEPGIDDKESPADVNLMAREPPVGIQEKYDKFRNTGVGDMKTFGTRTGTERIVFNTDETPKLWINIPEVAHHLTGTVDKLFESGMNTIKKDEEDDEEKPK